jgi:hypothetical protein
MISRYNWRDHALRIDLRLTFFNNSLVDIQPGFWYNPYMNKGMNMTDFEQNVLDMMIPKEQELLLRVLAQSSAREGAIVSLIAERLRDMVNSGLMDRLYPELVDVKEGI